MPTFLNVLHSIVLFYQPLQPGLGGRGVFMRTSLFCDHFVYNFICNRLIFDNRCENDISITDGGVVTL